MIVARWHVNARFGKKDEAISILQDWWKTIGSSIGQADYVMMTGSVGAAESLITVDLQMKDLAALNEQWEKLAQRTDHREWSDKLEPFIVSGSTRWEIFRIVE